MEEQENVSQQPVEPVADNQAKPRRRATGRGGIKVAPEAYQAQLAQLAAESGQDRQELPSWRRQRMSVLSRVTAEMNQRHAVAILGGGTHVYTNTVNEAGGEGFILQNPRDLALWYANQRVLVPKSEDGFEYLARDRIWLEHTDRRSIAGVLFRPGQDVPTGYMNLWKGWGVEPAFDSGAGCSLIRRHLFEVLCDADETSFRWFASWLAQLVQQPASKPGTAVILRSPEGTGKGLFFNGVMQKILNSAYLLVSQKKSLVGNFNSVLQGKLMVIADEPPFAGDKETSATLRSFITEPTLIVEMKHREPYEIANHVRVIFLSNLEWVVEASATARRWCVLDVNKRVRNRQYFESLAHEIENGGVESFFGWLLRYDFSGVDLRKPPVTQALVDQKVSSLGSVESWWHERLWSGELHGKDDTLAHGWPTRIPVRDLNESYREFCRQQSQKYPAQDSKLAKQLGELLGGALQRARGSRSGGMREWQYLLPELHECRAAFEAWVGATIKWDGDVPRDDDGNYENVENLTSRRPALDAIDDAIPF